MHVQFRAAQWANKSQWTEVIFNNRSHLSCSIKNEVSFRFNCLLSYKRNELQMIFKIVRSLSFIFSCIAHQIWFMQATFASTFNFHYIYSNVNSFQWIDRRIGHSKKHYLLWKYKMHKYQRFMIISKKFFSYTRGILLMCWISLNM